MYTNMHTFYSPVIGIEIKIINILSAVIWWTITCICSCTNARKLLSDILLLLLVQMRWKYAQRVCMSLSSARLFIDAWPLHGCSCSSTLMEQIHNIKVYRAVIAWPHLCISVCLYVTAGRRALHRAALLLRTLTVSFRLESRPLAHVI